MRRRITIVFGLVTAMALLDAPPAFAQAAPPQPPAQPTAPPATAPQPAAAQQGRAPALAFASEAGIVLSPIAPAQTAVFENVMQRVREALEKSADPVRRQQAAGWKIYKSADAFQGNTLYISVMDPAVKGADYDVFGLLKETMTDADARALFDQFRNAYGGPMHVVNMAPFLVMTAVEVPVKK